MIPLSVYYVYNVQLRYFISSDALKYLHEGGHLSTFSPPIRAGELNCVNCRRSRALFETR